MNNLALELNKSLKESDLSKEYFLLKEEIAKDEYINSLLKAIEEAKVTSNEAIKKQDIPAFNTAKLQLKLLNDEFLNHPLIVNYMSVKKEMYDLLEQIASILSE